MSFSVHKSRSRTSTAFTQGTDYQQQERYEDFTRLHPMKSIARTDPETKLIFADALSKAVFGKAALSKTPKAPSPTKKGSLRYAKTGIRRKVELCTQLHQEAE